jgi:hypothetical protein
MKKSLHILYFAMFLVIFSSSVQAADIFPTSGVFNNVPDESELNFAKKYLGFPDEECTFNSPLKIKPKTWRISLKCVGDGVPPKSTATLEQRGKIWRLQRGAFAVDFSK